jgi:general secretion pathway protein D
MTNDSVQIVRLTTRMQQRRPAYFVFGAVLLLGGCSGYQAYREGQARLADGQAEPGLAKLREATVSEPENVDYRRSYFAQRETVVNGLLREVDLAVGLGDFSSARLALDKISRVDPGNARIAPGLDRLAAAERHRKAVDAALVEAKEGRLDSAIAKTQQVLSENPNQRLARPLLRQLLRQQADATGKELGIYPKLKAAYRVPVTLSFTNASLLQVFEALKQASGLNYLVERDVKPDLKVTLSVTNKSVEDVVRLLLATNQLERRVLDGDTLLIYPNTAAKQAEYREMVVRSFYLSNAEAGKVAATVRTIAKARDLVVDEKLNMLMVRDTEDVVRLAEKVIASQDIAEPEVMLELEVMEVSVNRLLDIGIQWPTSASATVIGGDGVAGQLRLNELRNRTSSMVRLNATDPLVSGQFKSQAGDATLLANPRVRVRNKQSAKILIGERVPVITTTSTANVGNSQSISYLDVGLKLEIEPTVSLDDEVSMKIALEVSNITQTITLAGGTQAYRLGTRNTSTSLQVHDGETNILAGLIQRDRTHSNTGVPGLNELPLVNRLFGMAQDSDTRTEIVLLITPHIVRGLDVPGIGQQEFLSGTEAATGAAPIQLGQPAGPARSGGTGPALVQPNQFPRPPAASVVPPGPPGVTPTVPQVPPPSGPPLTPPAVPRPSAPAAPAPPAGLVPPTLIPSRPGT